MKAIREKGPVRRLRLEGTVPCAFLDQQNISNVLTTSGRGYFQWVATLIGNFTVFGCYWVNFLLKMKTRI